jgi:hypothetical protein
MVDQAFETTGNVLPDEDTELAASAGWEIAHHYNPNAKKKAPLAFSPVHAEIISICQMQDVPPEDKYKKIQALMLKSFPEQARQRLSAGDYVVGERVKDRGYGLGDIEAFKTAKELNTGTTDKMFAKVRFNRSGDIHWIELKSLLKV